MLDNNSLDIILLNFNLVENLAGEQGHVVLNTVYFANGCQLGFFFCNELQVLLQRMSFTENAEKGHVHKLADSSAELCYSVFIHRTKAAQKIVQLCSLQGPFTTPTLLDKL